MFLKESNPNKFNRVSFFLWIFHIDICSLETNLKIENRSYNCLLKKDFKKNRDKVNIDENNSSNKIFKDPLIYILIVKILEFEPQLISAISNEEIVIQIINYFELKLIRNINNNNNNNINLVKEIDERI